MTVDTVSLPARAGLRGFMEKGTIGSMSEQRNLLAATAEKVFSEASNIDEAGLSLVLVPEEFGGFGGGFEDAAAVFIAAGKHAIAAPVAEAVVAARLLSDSGVRVPDRLTLAQEYNGELRIKDSEAVFSGVLNGAAFGRDCANIAVPIAQDAEQFIAIFKRSDAKKIEERVNPAGEPRDHLRFENAKGICARTNWSNERLVRIMAFARACQMSGAMDAALELSVTHVRNRQQFGKPLASFQAIQQQLALFTEEAAAARAACRAAAHAMDRGEASFEIACAKLRANQASATATSVAHQVHGAIGFTREYDLQRFTRRLWSWRSEYGNDRHWTNEIGARVAQIDSENFWPALVNGFA